MTRLRQRSPGAIIATAAGVSLLGLVPLGCLGMFIGCADMFLPQPIDFQREENIENSRDVAGALGAHVGQGAHAFEAFALFAQLLGGVFRQTPGEKGGGIDVELAMMAEAGAGLVWKNIEGIFLAGVRRGLIAQDESVGFQPRFGRRRAQE